MGQRRFWAVRGGAEQVKTGAGAGCLAGRRAAPRGWRRSREEETASEEGVASWRVRKEAQLPRWPRADQETPARRPEEG